METFLLGEAHLTPGKALDLVNGKLKGVLSGNTRKKITESADHVLQMVDRGEPVYGINTGFGPLCTTSISKEETRMLQSNILKSHSVGVGPPIANKLAKLMLVLKVHSLAQGYSGIQLDTLMRMLWHIEKEVIPVVPSQGSVGASGDLAPLAHLFLPLLGLGKVSHRGQIVSGEEFLKRKRMEPLELGPKEGLALINGTQFILAHAVTILERFQNCLDQADIMGTMMLEGLQGSISPFHPKLHQLRPFIGSQHVAGRIRTLLQGSEILEDHIDCDRVQDPYSVRCMPQVHGASRAAWLHLKELVEIELNAVTDNPIIIDGNNAISGGNFHGQPLAMALDYTALAASELGNISDRRIYLALEGGHGIPQLLMKDTGINSGYMILQYTSAALASENKGLCFPSSADSIPTSLGQEDHVSMGSIGGRKALQIIGNLENILAIELLTAAQAFEYRKPLKSGILMDEVHQFIRTKIPFAEKDRVFSEDIDAAVALVRSGEIPLLIKEVMFAKGITWETVHRREFDTL